jgi:hypothetical protein
MDLLGGPAALGGIIACIALVAWALGRWHGSALAANPANGPAHCPAPTGQHPPFEWRMPDPAEAGSAVPCQHSQRAGREIWFEKAFSVGELHAEVSAYRRQQRVFAAGAGDALPLAPLPAGARQEWRDLGLIGQTSGAMTSAALPACGAVRTAAAPLPERAAQPLALGSALTRV